MQDWGHQQMPWNNVRDYITSVVINDGITTIGNSAFMYCHNLVSVSIPNTVISIGDNAFDTAGLITIDIPSSVKSIGAYALQCNPFTEIHIKNPIPPTVGWACFWAVNTSQCKLYVPKGSLDAYKSADGWKDFFNILAEDVTGVGYVQIGKISISPNPTKSEIFIKSELLIKKVEIYSLTGVLLKLENNFKEKISISALPNGVYLLKVHSDNGFIVKKIVKK
jgi:hypothetical protein